MGKHFFSLFTDKMNGIFIPLLLRHTELAMALCRPVFSKVRTLSPGAGISVLCIIDFTELAIVSWKNNRWRLNNVCATFVCFMAVSYDFTMVL